MRFSLILPLALAAVVACTPALNWREVRVEGSGAVAMFPCKPDVQARNVELAGERVKLTLAACRAGELTFALAFADMSSAVQVAPALASLKTSAAANLGAALPAQREIRVEGMTPNLQTQRVSLQGKGAKGEPLVEEVAFFSKGVRVFQATILGGRVDAEVTENFFSGLKLPS